MQQKIVHKKIISSKVKSFVETNFVGDDVLQETYQTIRSKNMIPSTKSSGIDEIPLIQRKSIMFSKNVDALNEARGVKEKIVERK